MNTESDSTGAENAEPKLEELLSGLLRAKWEISIRLAPNEWGGLTQAVLIFSRLGVEERTVPEDMEALKSGQNPSTPIETTIELIDPASLYKAVKRIHTLFVRPQ